MYNSFEARNMKKSDVINLIKYHYQKEEEKFFDQSFEIARLFEKEGDLVISQYIESILNKDYNLVPQAYGNNELFQVVNTHMRHPLYFPDSLHNDISGIVNAINNNRPISKFLFTGLPGTGKTEASKHIANLTGRKLISINFTSLVDSRLGETLKNIEKMFATINNTIDLKSSIILFDELDIIALDRVNKNDLREMGRATSLFIKCLDALDQRAIIVATTNLGSQLDRAIKRRFDFVVNFDVYTQTFLSEIAVAMAREYNHGINSKTNSQILKKIVVCSECKISPSELRNIIKISFAFSDPNNQTDYLKRIFLKLYEPDMLDDVDFLYSKLKLTYREIEILSGIPKSTAQRIINQGNM